MSRPFTFKEFTIQQKVNAQKVGSDSMLLGAWIAGDFSRILDIGTGTGILALMMAQKNPGATVTAIEPDLESLKEAHLNFQSSKFAHQFLTVHSRLQDFGSVDKFDLIVCNPPYFENAFLSKNSDRNRARHTDDLEVYELYESASELLLENGVLAVVFPTDEEQNHLKQASLADLFPLKILRTIREDGSFKRSLMLFSFDETFAPEVDSILVKDSHNRYSSEYIALTKSFYSKDLEQIQSK